MEKKLNIEITLFFPPHFVQINQILWEQLFKQFPPKKPKTFSSLSIKQDFTFPKRHAFRKSKILKNKYSTFNTTSTV